MEEINITVHITTQEKDLVFKCNSSTNVDELRTDVCKELKITPIAKSLFSFQIHNTKLFLEDSATLGNHNHFNLRIRYKVPNLSKLKQLDPDAYNYYFHQVRKDVLDNNIPEILYSKYREELLGLGISDMYRAMIEEKKTQQDIMKEYKKYIPKEVTKKHSIFTKKPICNTLDILQKKYLAPDFIIEKYMNQFNSMAPNYLSEEYKVIIDKNGILEEGMLLVMPFHTEQPGLRMSVNKEKKIEHLCTIGELCFMTIRGDGTIELCRKNGIPVYLKFDSVDHMRSFVSVCDGYYRLMIKWTFNICKDIPSPHLAQLHSFKCHGPVGGVFSYHKLQEKRSNKAGWFILRQCEQIYDVYYIDVCNKKSLKPMTYKIKKIDDGYIFNENDSIIYPNIINIINAHKNSEDDIYLQDCLPPSEYDKSQLLICQPVELTFSSNISHNDLDNVMFSNKGPLCISSKDLQLYRGTRIEGSENLSCFYKARWNVAQGKIMEVAMKMLKQDSSEEYLKDFIDHAGQWAFLKSANLVRLYGITLRSPVAMVMELLPFGPLDAYLRNKEKLQVVDLVEAAASLATALWHLDENGIIHGNIRCRKMLVANHDSSKFTVKLSDQGLYPEYKEEDIHWVPIEFYNNLALARKSTSSDVWAFATTLWEIFSFGVSPNTINQPLTKKNYISGNRLNMPISCPEGIYSIMRDCWVADPHIRSRPQAIMRDVNKLLYQVFNSRRKHSYAAVFSNPSTLISHDESNLLAASEAYNDKYNVNSDNTSLNDYDLQEDTISYDLTNQWSGDQLQNIYEFEGYNVVLQGLIGQGFYGYVFKGTLHKDEDCQSRELKTVAVKKLKPNCQSDDFDQEIKIAKTLKHPNIVEIYGIVESPEILLIMEFIPHGSLNSYLKIHRFSITTKQLLKYALDVAKGMEYLETMQVVHRDLAARNILVVDENYVKITDFGLAREIDKGGYYLFKSDRELPINWYAPECKTSSKFSTKSDVWSYGVTLWEMFSYGIEPPQCDQDVSGKKIFNRLPCPESCPNGVYTTLMLSCWQFEPSERPTFSLLVTNCSKLLPCF